MHKNTRIVIVTLVAAVTATCPGDSAFVRGAEPAANHRPPVSPSDLKYWLGNMVWYHRYAREEITAATGLGPEQIDRALKGFDIRPETRPYKRAGSPLPVLPYPGGRHPRIGFLDGAIDPQRETKISVFAPWDQQSYVVVDVPEAIWSNVGLVYLAHTHVPTVWTKQSIRLKPLEWNRRDDGSLDIRRELPNGIVFATSVRPQVDFVRMEMSLTNGTATTLRDLRVQMCVMLRGCEEFTAQSNENKVFQEPYSAVRSADGRRWVITAWEPCHRAWGNAACPCLHSDPKFPDCAPGETQSIRGFVSFYEGDDARQEFRRIEATGWRRKAS